MLSVANRERYAKHRAAREAQSRSAVLCNELILPALVFGSIGAIAWAIRGTNGWGGMDGTIVPGMMWGILWYYVCFRKGIACHGVPLWLGLGIALGGELGYGQYVSWIQGLFNVGDEVIHVDPWIGWAWFLLCGIGWGAPGGVLLGWALSSKSSLRIWIGRLTIPFGIAWLGLLLVQWHPEFFFPNYGLGIYAGELGRHLERTVYTNTQNFAVVAWWVGAVTVAAIQRDKTSFAMCAIIGGGFGPGFMSAALWCLGYEYAPQYIDWWKVWELNSGFNLGLLYVLALYWCVRQVDQSHDSHGAPLAPADAGVGNKFSALIWCIRNLFETLAVFVMVLVLYLEGEPQTSIFMGLLYVVFMGWFMLQAARGLDPAVRSELHGRVTMIFCVFLFLFVTLHGATSTIGLVLELYPPESVEQYSWPPKRVLLFLPMAMAVVMGTVYHMVRTLRQQPRNYSAARIADRITNLMTGLAAVGAVSIWPSEIGVLYALLLCVAVAAFNSMNRRFNKTDALQSFSAASLRSKE